MRFLRTILLMCVSCWMLSSCSPVRQLGPNEYLLNKNKIKSDRKELNEGAYSILKQKPNRKILGLFRFHMGVYTLANTGNPTRFKNWVKKTIGEAPVIVDSSLTDRSTLQIKQYMQNEGYFNAVVSDTTEYTKRKKARVTYTIASGEPYIINSLFYSISDPVVKTIVFEDSTNCRLKKGNNYKTSMFQAERERITKLLRNFGFYEFSQLYISYDVDSALKSHKVNITLNIAGTNESVTVGESVFPGQHKVYRIKAVYILTDHDPLSKVIIQPSDTLFYKNYHFLSSTKKLKYKPDALLPRIFIEQGSLYKINNAEYTYKGLSNLGLFRFINVKFDIIENDSIAGNWLNSHIHLSPAPKQDYKVDLEGTHNGGNFGGGVSFTYRNKNTFRGAESMELRLRGKVESIPDFVNESERQSLNTFEVGPELSFRVPRMLWPLAKLDRSRSANPVTVFRSSFNYQQRPEYTRNQLVFSTGFEFSETKYKKHFVYPAEINFSNYNLTDAFDQKLKDRNDQRLIQYYKNSLITNGRYAFVYNTQEQNILRDFFFLRFSFEIAGNSMRLLDKLFKPNYNDSISYDVLGINYSQYILPEIDLRFYQVINEHNTLVYRINSAIGISYLNSVAMPYQKIFFTGGANDLRAFRVRTVGPGAYSEIDSLEHVGDIKIVGNLELRTNIFRYLKGAVFVDAGNVWMRKDDLNLPGGQFKSATFLDEFALGAGLGIRFDFDFFILRIDAGVPFKDPSRAVGDRWVFNQITPRKVVYNFGIGYPF